VIRHELKVQEEKGKITEECQMMSAVVADKVSEVEQRKEEQGLTQENVTKTIAYFGRKLNMSEFDRTYAAILYSKYLDGKTRQLELLKTMFPTAVLFDQSSGCYKSPREAGYIDLATIEREYNLQDINGEIIRRVIQMKGGLGTSYGRLNTLRRLGVRSMLADKATDSIFEEVLVSGWDRDGVAKLVPINLSVAEIKTQRLINDSRKRRIILQDMVNADSRQAVKDFYQKTVYVLDRADKRPGSKKRTYQEVIKQTPGIKLAPDFIEQGFLPLIDAVSGKFIDSSDPNAKAPGGHGFLGTYMLARLAQEGPAKDEIVVTEVVNGDPNNFSIEKIADYMVKERIPLVMITTERTPIDKKGGLMGEELMPGGQMAPQIFEKAQAELVGQYSLFVAMGLTRGKLYTQEFNTNISVYNENLLHGFLSKLKVIIGEEEFLKTITPDLIINSKTRMIDGKKVDIFQLEGAKSSALLNINKYVMTTKNEKVKNLVKESDFKDNRLLHFVSVNAENRIRVFAQEKFAGDHALLGRSDLFRINVQRGVIEKVVEKGRNRAYLPEVDFDNNYTRSEYWKDNEAHIKAWGKEVGLREYEPKSITIYGKVLFANAIFGRGRISIENRVDKIVDLNCYKGGELSQKQGRLFLDDISVVIDENGVHTALSRMIELKIAGIISQWIRGRARKFKESDILNYVEKRLKAKIPVNYIIEQLELASFKNSKDAGGAICWAPSSCLNCLI
jgi:hypothetical protein